MEKEEMKEKEEEKEKKKEEKAEENETGNKKNLKDKGEKNHLVVIDSSARKASEIPEEGQHRFKKSRWTLTQGQLNANVGCE
jgi:hypothetical protein